MRVKSEIDCWFKYLNMVDSIYNACKYNSSTSK